MFPSTMGTEDALTPAVSALYSLSRVVASSSCVITHPISEAWALIRWVLRDVLLARKRLPAHQKVPLGGSPPTHAHGSEGSSCGGSDGRAAMLTEKETVSQEVLLFPAGSGAPVPGCQSSTEDPTELIFWCATPYQRLFM